MSQPRHPVTGKRVTVTADTEGELHAAVSRIRNVRTNMRLGATVAEAEQALAPALGVRMMVDEAWGAYESGLHRSREKAQCIWERRLKPWFSGKSLWELRADVMRSWEGEQRRSGYAIATIGLAYDMIAAAVNLQVPTVIPCLPWGKWRPERESKDEMFVPKRPAIGDLGTFALLVREAASDDEKAWKRARYSCHAKLAIFLGMTMMRQGEAAGLAWDHVDVDSPIDPAHPELARNVLFIEWQAAKGWTSRHTDRPRDMPKDGQRRLLLHPAVVALLREQRAELQKRGWYRPDGPVWPAPGGRWIRTGKVLEPRRIRQWATRAGLPRADEWCAHSLRHTGVMLEIQAHGGDLISVMRRSGHSDLRVMRGYMHAMGGLLPPSRIGLTDGDAKAMLPALPGASGEMLLLQEANAQPGALARVLSVESDVRELAEREREQARQAKKDREREPLEVIFRRWDAMGRPGKQPSEITARARLAYMKGYNEKAREVGKGHAAQCQAAGKSARGRFLGAWSLAVQRLSRVTNPDNPHNGSEAEQ